MTPLRTHMSGAPSGLSLHHFSKSETQYYSPNPALIPPPSSVSGRAGLVVVVKTCRLEIIFVRNERHVASAAHSPEPAVVVVVSKDPFPLWIFCSEDFSVQALRLESKRVGVSRRASLYYSLAIIRINTKLEGGRRRETGDERGEKVLLLNGCLQNIFTHWWMKLLAEVICEWESVILPHNLLWNWNVKFYDRFYKTEVIFR